MIDLSAVREEFAELKNIILINAEPSGQKDVLRATRGEEAVALKLIKPNANDARIEREIEAVLMLDHLPYVPKVYDHGRRMVAGSERYFIVEQFILGETYRQCLRRQPIQPLEEVLRIGGALLAACRDFEEKRVVHRDIKPENLIVGSDKRLWVIDFGIARLLDAESLTATSMRVGPCTLGYCAPEQLRNQKPQIDSRADLFSVGVVLHESLTGANPYLLNHRGPLDVIQRMENQDLPRLTIPGPHGAALADFLSSLTSRFASRRPTTAGEALAWFQEVTA